ncbi:response regulator [Undibacterium sp. LX40W]|uniref:Response regulator n=1 Tax=Undibacterium nitidum TaxID=2762298 RepID=A0A923HP34_9BURK|nr:response regulator [Undibacterium nitidum]MBC3880655.1 response regulator [Undibacterium nitidum]MBC3890609.1 response regulator [Undibacterium sp. LX40W]
MIRVLVVEDDKEIRALVKSSLEVEGFEVLTAVSIAEAQRILNHAKPDLLILDLGLPDGDGAELVHSVRKEQNLPIIIISARDQEAQKIRLLDAGADDYLSKPFGVQELLARIRVALRHRGTVIGVAQTLLEVDQLKIDLSAHRITLKGQELHLTPTEYNLMARLVRSAGKVVTHRQLLVDVWGEEFIDHTHYLRLYMGQLRAKIEDQPAEPRYLLTETGVGYRLVTE